MFPENYLLSDVTEATGNFLVIIKNFWKHFRCCKELKWSSMLMNQLKISLKSLQIEFFVSFWVSVFFASVVSPMLQKTSLRGSFYCNLSLTDVPLQETTKCAFGIEYPLSYNSIASEKTRLKSNIYVSIRIFVHYQEYSSKRSVVTFLGL